MVLRLSLIDSLVQSGRLDEAESVLQSLQKVCEPLSSQMKIALPPPIDLRRGEIALHRRDYSGRWRLVSEMTGDKEVMAQSNSGRQTIYKACLVLGGANAGLKRWDQAMAAYEQAVALQPSELAPAWRWPPPAWRPAGAAHGIRHYQQAAYRRGRGPAAVHLGAQQIYQWLIWLLEQESRAAEAGRYRELRKESIAESAERFGASGGRGGLERKIGRSAGDRPARRPKPPPGSGGPVGLGNRRRRGASEARAAFAEAARLAPDDPRYLQAPFNSASKPERWTTPVKHSTPSPAQPT